ncbi:MAG: beta-ketoacyl-[acyl-carrier-protein] synthase I, partial [Buchnera aphidicola]|nr:beta-ketoacyl-[acyl-carrier-protein] synthase I [Buchnera aphidicola]
LYHGISGIEFSQEMKDYGLRSHIWGNIKLDIESLKKERIFRFMNDGAIYTFLSLQQALEDSNLKKNQYQKNSRIGIITGSGA